MNSPTKPAPSAGPNASYINSFGYHLAKKILGASHVNECIRQAYRLQQQREDQSEDSFHCFRANWRSNARFPWQLPNKFGGDHAPDGERFSPEMLFVDITFDFIISAMEIVDQGRTNCCHVVPKEDFCGDDENIQEEMGDEDDSIAMAAAIRIGALVGMPLGKNKAGDGYQYFYQRGEKALTVSDLDEHCKSIDIILEEMDSADVARIMGDAFSEGCGSGTKVWQVATKSENGNAATRTSSKLTTIDNYDMNEAEKANKQSDWHLKLNHQTLEADGLLPLSNNGDNMGESIGRCMLDMILLQSNATPDCGTCVSVPKSEALKLWKNINPALVKALERPLEPSPKKMSPVRKGVIVSLTSSPIQKADQKEEINGNKSSKTKSAARRPHKPQPTALFARGKRTTLGGSRRKKPKFTLGPA